MKILLDTATFLWVVLSPSRLSSVAVRLYEDPLNEVYLSAASVYEIVVKVMLGKLDVGGSPSRFVRAEREPRGILALPIDEDAAFAVERLPLIHADPFDRLLIAQSIASGMTLLTPDAVIARYPMLSIRFYRDRPTATGRQRDARGCAPYVESLPEAIHGIHDDIGATWDDFAAEVEQITRWDRVAVVTEVGWVEGATRLFGLILPATTRLFRSSETAAARTWISATTSPTMKHADGSMRFVCAGQ